MRTLRRYASRQVARADGARRRARSTGSAARRARCAINTPALLLRSKVPDPARLIGARTFLHPSVVSAATFDEPIDGFDGAPQSIYSDHFLGLDDVTGPIGYKLEVPPIHPVLYSTTMSGFADEHLEGMKHLRTTHAMIALMRDGFHPESRGGRVELRNDSTPVLDYPLTPVLFDGARRALLTMAELQFAAGQHAHRQGGGEARMTRVATHCARCRCSCANAPTRSGSSSGRSPGWRHAQWRAARRRRIGFRCCSSTAMRL